VIDVFDKRLVQSAVAGAVYFPFASIDLPEHSGDGVAGCQADVEDFFASIDDHKVARDGAVKVKEPACAIGIYFVGTVNRGIGEKIPHGYSVSTYGLARRAMSTGTVKRDKAHGGERTNARRSGPVEPVGACQGGVRTAFLLVIFLRVHLGHDA